MDWTFVVEYSCFKGKFLSAARESFLKVSRFGWP